MSRIHDFWGGAEGAPLVILSDFDYTISQVDVGDLICDNLCPASAETLRAFGAGEIGSRRYWLDSMARADMVAAAALADTVAIDPHFGAFAAWAAAEKLPLAVVSDGFGFYISRILGREGLGHLPIFCNEMPGPGRLEFPHGNAGCDRCGCCKAAVVRRLRQSGAAIVYIGDGTSDMYASAFADWVFAKGSLARFLTEQKTPFFPFETFADVAGHLAANLGAFRAGTAPGRVTLAPSPHCRF